MQRLNGREVEEADDAVGRAAERLASSGVGAWLGQHAGGRTIEVVFRGTPHKVHVPDSGVRPPHPAGFWFDDLLSAACRVRFGFRRGSARPVQGRPGAYEFREAWPEPALADLADDIRVAADGRPTETLRVRTKHLAGADPASVVFASAYAACVRKFGPGKLQPHAGLDHAFHFHPGGPADDPLVDARYTVHRPGGTAHEVHVRVLPRVAADWTGLVAAVRYACTLRWGPGKLSYMPEVGETHFTYS
ncbi:MAG: hypothetical protein K2X82_08260 [Gemmataceae bacterium]|nr:hypothetical protein [Gemmataceae bacterium]